jgi:hypothetical protein
MSTIPKREGFSPEKTRHINTPDVCIICKEPAYSTSDADRWNGHWHYVGEAKRHYAKVAVKKTAKSKPRITWHAKGWQPVTAKLCKRHYEMNQATIQKNKDAHGKAWAPPPKPSVSPARVRKASYQAAQMDHGQLSYFDRSQWIALHTDGTTMRAVNGTDKLSSAIAKHIPFSTPDLTLPALPALCGETQRLKDRRASARARIGRIPMRSQPYRINDQRILYMTDDGLPVRPNGHDILFCAWPCIVLPAPNGAPKPQPVQAIEPTPYTITIDRQWTWVGFPEKPPEPVRTVMKQAGFRWSRKREQWYRMDLTWTGIKLTDPLDRAYNGTASVPDTPGEDAHLDVSPIEHDLQQERSDWRNR